MSELDVPDPDSEPRARATGTGEPDESADSPEPSRTGYHLLALIAAFLIPVAFHPDVYASYWAPKSAVVVLIGLAAVPLLVFLARDRHPAALAAIAFLVVAGVSTALADVPVLSFFGLYNIGKGWLFFLAVFALWALGRMLDVRAAREIQWAIGLAIVVSTIAAVSQTLFDLAAYQLATPQDRADAFLGNPVHLGALTAGGWAMASVTWVTTGSRAWLGIAVAAATALQLSGTRIALVIAVVATVGIGLLHRRARAVLLVPALALGIGLGAATANIGEAPSGTDRVASLEASGFTARTEVWKGSIEAIQDNPVVGAGPDRFMAATGPYRTARLALAEGPDKLFADGHNLVFEILVTTGVLGLVALAAFVWFATRRVRGPLAWFALCALALLAAQPIDVGVVPVSAIALGAAALPARASDPDRRRPGKPYVIASVGTGAVGLAMAGMLLVGDYSRNAANLDFRIIDAERSDDLLPPWPETAEMLGRMHLFRSVITQPDDPRELAIAIEWRREATERDPANPAPWNDLGELQLTEPDVDGAKRSFERALAQNPQSARALVGLGEAAMATGDGEEAARWYRRALDLTVNESNRRFLENRIRRAESLG